MSEDQFAVFLSDNRTAFRPGETLNVAALWALASAPARVEARLFWRTCGKGTEDIEIVARQPLTGVGAAGEQTVPFTLPDSPWSFSGKLISLTWGVEVVAEPGGQSARCEFVLGPNGQEILLPVLDDAARA
jgi:hypothetical protein